MRSMRNRFKLQLYGKLFGYGSLIVISMIIIGYMLINKSIEREKEKSTSIQQVIKKECERAYFEGQRDAIEGDIRIKKTKESCWIWTKSCWDSGTPTEYVPCLNLK